METLRAEHTGTMLELQHWARRLHHHGRYPCDALRRYAIGIYQLYQARDWRGTDSEYESYAAAAIHILTACEAMEIPTEAVFRDQRIVDIPFGVGGTSSLLYNISKLQGQLVYATNSSSIKRKSRFKIPTAANAGGCLVLELFGNIPPSERRDAIYSAMEIMTGEL